MCQETSPGSGEGPIPSSPSRLSPLPPNPHEAADLDLESQPPVIHDIVTSSPGDNEPLGATPFVTTIDLGAPLDIPASELLPEEPEEPCSAPLMTEMPVAAEQVLDTAADITVIPASPVTESPVFTAEPEVSVPTETLTASDPSSYVEADTGADLESTELPSQVQESPISDLPAPEDVGAVEAGEEEEEEEVVMEEEEVEQTETWTPEEREEGMVVTCCDLHSGECIHQVFEGEKSVLWFDTSKFDISKTSMCDGEGMYSVHVHDMAGLQICKDTNNANVNIQTLEQHAPIRQYLTLTKQEICSHCGLIFLFNMKYYTSVGSKVKRFLKHDCWVYVHHLGLLESSTKLKMI